MFIVSESRWRSACKGVTYRLFATLVTSTATFLITGRLKTAAVIASTELGAKVLLYWAHERIWARITWGSRYRLRSAGRAGHHPTPAVEAFEATRRRATGEHASLPDPLAQSPALNAGHAVNGTRHTL
jgi:uncharacterized membrane protein